MNVANPLHHKNKLSTITSNCFTSAFAVNFIFIPLQNQNLNIQINQNFRKKTMVPLETLIDRLALRYSKGPINPRYSFSSNTFPWLMKILFSNCFICQLIFLELIKFFFHNLYPQLIHLFVWILFWDTRTSDFCSMNFIIPR